MSTILAIESSCDDTSVAIIRNFDILSNTRASQEVHEKNGGVVPELASREHVKNIIPVLENALQKAELDFLDIDAIAFTKGPGLIGSLLVGTSVAKSLSMVLDKPLIEVNHIHGHIFCHFISDACEKSPKFPFLCLTASGGHTFIALVKENFKIEIVGETLDDAAGEAFDKIGRRLGLDYPGGMYIDKKSTGGNPEKFTFSKPKIKDYDYSFSGLKTQFLNFINKEEQKNPDFVNENLSDLCASIQKTIVDILLDKLLLAAKDLSIKNIAISGGVAANSRLRNEAQNLDHQGFEVYVPKKAYTTDNAAMIALVGQIKYSKSEFAGLDSVPEARFHIGK